VPIPGTTHRSHLEENVAALGIELTEQDLNDIREAMPQGAEEHMNPGCLAQAPQKPP